MVEYKAIKSFIKRQRKLGKAKQKIFDEICSRYRLDVTAHPISPEKIFGRHSNLVLEIGCGNGETIFSLAQKYPEQDFIGIEVYKPGIAHLLTLLNSYPLDNIRIYHEDAIIVIPQCIPNQSLDKILILFPDPWPKRRHQKRRLIQTEFITILQHKLKPGGVLNIVTDWENYADHIKTVLKSNPNFSMLNSLSPLTLLQERIIPTKFEQRGKNQGRQVFEMLFVNNISI